MGSNIGVPVRAINRRDMAIQVDTLPGPAIELFSGPAKDYLKLGVPLYRAALEGDWETAKRILDQHPNLARARIGKTKDTALHIAAAAERDNFVKELVEYMTADDLELRNERENTALCFAAASGSVEIARVMVAKKKELPLIRGSDGMTPLHMATLLGHNKMVWYLMSVTDFDKLSEIERFELLITAINSDLYDVALEILKEFPSLAEYIDAENKTALQFLARKQLKAPSNHMAWWKNCWHFLQFWSSSRTREKIWGEITKKNYEEISHCFGSPSRFLFAAAEVGNIEFIAILIGSYPDLIWKVNEDRMSIFHIAVLKRQEKVFNLIYEIGSIRRLLATYTDNKGNNMLHLAAMSPPPASLNKVSGAALQMQRELLWYKAVEVVVPRQFMQEKNEDKDTPELLFAKEHEQLRKDGEEWMKTTATSCSVVAALIATVVFTAAFTVPGGNDQNNGTPIFQRTPIFVVFAVADALSFFTSSIAIMMFLGILTSRYAQEDFLTSLPEKLIIGLSMLFISIACMMVAFASTFFIIFKAGIAWISIPIAVAFLVTIPVVLFAFQQFPLLTEIYRSTYKTRYLFRPRKYKIFKEYKENSLLRRLGFKFFQKHD